MYVRRGIAPMLQSLAGRDAQPNDRGLRRGGL